MMERQASQEILKDVPKEKFNQIVEDYESEGAEIETIRQPNGKWTIIATFGAKRGRQYSETLMKRRPVV